MFSRTKPTQKAVEFLRKANGEISYTAIALALDIEEQKAKQIARRAMNILERDKIVFTTIRGYGFKRLTDTEKVESVSQFTRRIHSAAKKGTRRVESVNPTGLSNDDQMRLAIARTVFAVVSEKSRKQ